jgi:PBP1b-binding outer membrane lipoprotein LpoB
MKKLILMAGAILCMAIFLAGCAGTDAQTPPTSSATESQENTQPAVSPSPRSYLTIVPSSIHPGLPF